jgi:hypothetical protein
MNVKLIILNLINLSDHLANLFIHSTRMYVTVRFFVCLSYPNLQQLFLNIRFDLIHC